MAGVRDVEAVARRQVQDAGPPHILEQRRGCACRRAGARRTPPRAAPPRWSPAGRSPPARSTPCTTTAPARIRSARAGLMPGTLLRSAAGSEASRRTSSSRAARVDDHTLHSVGGQPRGALGGGGEVAHRPADAHQAPAVLADPASDSHEASASSAGDVVAQLLDLPALGGAVRRAGSARSSAPCPHARSRTRAPADRRRGRAASSPLRGPARSRRSSVVELTAAR